MTIQDTDTRVEDLAGLALRTAAKRGRKPATLENKRHAWEAKIVPTFRRVTCLALLTLAEVG